MRFPLIAGDVLQFHDEWFVVPFFAMSPNGIATSRSVSKQLFFSLVLSSRARGKFGRAALFEDEVR